MSDLSPQRQSVLDEVARSAKSGSASWAKIRDTLFRTSGTTWETAAGHLRELEKVGLVTVDRVKRNDSATWLVSLPQVKDEKPKEGKPKKIGGSLALMGLAMAMASAGGSDALDFLPAPTLGSDPASNVGLIRPPSRQGLTDTDRYHLDRATAKRARKQAKRLAEGR